MEKRQTIVTKDPDTKLNPAEDQAMQNLIDSEVEASSKIIENKMPPAETLGTAKDTTSVNLSIEEIRNKLIAQAEKAESENPGAMDKLREEIMAKAKEAFSIENIRKQLIAQAEQAEAENPGALDKFKEQRIDQANDLNAKEEAYTNILNDAPKGNRYRYIMSDPNGLLLTKYIEQIKEKNIKERSLEMPVQADFTDEVSVAHAYTKMFKQMLTMDKSDPLFISKEKQKEYILNAIEEQSAWIKAKEVAYENILNSPDGDPRFDAIKNDPFMLEQYIIDVGKQKQIFKPDYKGPEYKGFY